MLSCKEIVERSSEYLDKNMTLRQRLQVALHLLVCGNCRGFIRHMKLGIDMFRSMPDKILSDEEAEEITRRITGKQDLTE